ncbi:MAG: diguanylate cyclase [Actinomycetota bacterium]|nr:diguanylate cyclase [Actinomycetota bacterium]
MVDDADDHPRSGTWSGLPDATPRPGGGVPVDDPPWTLPRHRGPSSVVAVFKTRPDGTCASVDTAWLELTGLEPHQALGSHLWLAVHPGDRVAVARAWHRAVAVARPVHVRFRVATPGGRTRWVEIRASPRLGRSVREPTYTTVAVEVPGATGGDGISEVPTLTDGVSEIAEGVIEVDPNGRVLSADETAAEIFGRAVGDIVGAPIDGLVHRDEHDPAQRILGGGGGATQERRRVSHEMRLPDDVDGPRWVQLSATPGPPGAGSPGVAVTVTDITLRRNAERRLAELALHDTLTGLPNRALIKDRLHAATERAARSGGLVAVLFIDLDRFKLVNDIHGHATGDAVLVEVARRIQALTRHGDTTGRLAGDEFVVVCEHLTSGADAEWLAGRVRAALDRPFEIDGTQHRVSASIGIALSSGRVAEPDELLWAADAAMYEAKAAGPGRSAVRRDRSGAAELDVRSERDELSSAIERGELDIRFEPVVDVGPDPDQNAVAPPVTYATTGWWHRGDGAVLGHRELTELAEQHGLGLSLAGHLLREACLLAVALDAADGHVAVSVPVSARQLLQPRLSLEVQAALVEHAVSPGSLTLDVAATVLLQASDLADRQLGELRALGVRLTLDDFGNQLAALWHLDRDRFDTVNLGRSLIARSPDDGRARAITRAITATAHELGLATVALAVDTRGTARRGARHRLPAGPGRPVRRGPAGGHRRYRGTSCADVRRSRTRRARSRRSCGRRRGGAPSGRAGLSHRAATTPHALGATPSAEPGPGRRHVPGGDGRDRTGSCSDGRVRSDGRGDGTPGPNGHDGGAGEPTPADGREPGPADVTTPSDDGGHRAGWRRPPWLGAAALVLVLVLVALVALLAVAGGVFDDEAESLRPTAEGHRDP